MIVLIKLILAHLIGDFFLQPLSWVKAKEIKKLKAYQLYLHATLHGVLILLLVWDLSFVKWAIILAFIHLIIDVLKIYLQKDTNKRFYFFADQIAHFLTILIVYYWYKGFSLFNSSLFSDINFLLVTMIVFLTFPAAIFIKMFIAKWSPGKGDQKDESLKEAGKYIGILERLFVFAFVILGHWEAIGFLLAAKSIFRFGDLKESKDRKLTEYMLIGTLISFGIAILAGLTYLYLLSK
jgi:hypothetical protein